MQSRRSACILPVIHFDSKAAAMANAELAYSTGCDGVLLIHMDGKDHLLSPVACDLKARWPDWRVGINHLTRDPMSSLHSNLKDGLDMTWADRPGVSSSGASRVAEAVAQTLKSQGDGHVFLGSVAFKYQDDEPNPGAAAVIARRLGMVPTTSGAATGEAAPVEKLQTMSAAIDGSALGLASGITPENALTFAPFVTHFLVATGISRSFYEFCPDRLEALVKTLRG